jgi:glycosyltransferase involved in cell wall biosynthesis
MTRKVNILYLQHADALGGSVVSLRELIVDALENNYNCTVVCPNLKVAKVYDEIGAKTYVNTVARLHHNTVYHYPFSIIGFLRFTKAILKTFWSFIRYWKILTETKPDIVHLNSSTLILCCIFFRIIGVPVILHVRENIVEGNVGIRKNLIRILANKMATAIIYISEYEFQILGTQPDKSFVIYNYVHEDAFKSKITPLKPSKEKFVLITLGGLFKLKGGNIILQSLAQVSNNIELLILGCDDPRLNDKEILQSETVEYLKELLTLLSLPEIDRKVKFIGKVNDPESYISAADALIFWAALPHFPRPVFEAWLLKIPVIYFNPLFKNGLINTDNTLQVEVSSPTSLREAINNIKSSVVFTDSARERSYALAKLNFTQMNFKKINGVYQSCLNG